MGIADILGPKRKEILSTAAKHGARKVRGFGSVARDEAGPDSDIDLLVEFDKGRSLLDHAALLLDLQPLLGRPMDIVTPRGVHPRMRARIFKEAVAL